MTLGERSRWIALIGPSPQSNGGVAHVIAQVKRIALADDLKLVTVTSFRDGTSFAKSLSWLAGLSRFAILAALRRPALAYVHIAAGASTFRKASFLAVARALRVPVLLHIHTAGFLDQLGGTGLSSAAARWCVRESKGVVVLADTFAETVLALHPGACVHIVHNAPDVDEESPMSAGQRVRGRVLYLGAFVANKGVDVLADATALIAHDLPELRLALAGSGPGERMLRERLATAGVADRVEFLGWVRGGDREAEHARASLFVLPSRTEGSPLALLEAMWHGLPCIATEVGAVPEILADGAGVTVAREDAPALAAAMRSLLEDPEAATAMGKKAAQRVRGQYGPARQREAIRELLERYSRPAAGSRT